MGTTVYRQDCEVNVGVERREGGRSKHERWGEREGRKGEHERWGEREGGRDEHERGEKERGEGGIQV